MKNGKMYNGSGGPIAYSTQIQVETSRLKTLCLSPNGWHTFAHYRIPVKENNNEQIL